MLHRRRRRSSRPARASGPYSVIGAHSHIGESAVVDGAILWPNTWVDASARLGAALAGRHCHFGRNVEIGDGAMFGDKSRHGHST